MEKIIVNNLTCQELCDLESALHHIISCYSFRSHTCKGLVNDEDYRHLDSVILSSDDFTALSKLHERLYTTLYGTD